MKKILIAICCTFLFLPAALTQTKHIWVLRPDGEMTEYAPGTFALKQKVKIPAEAYQSPQSVSVNHLGQILFATAASLPLADSDMKAPHKIWLWDGRVATMIDQGVTRTVAREGSDQAITETAPMVFLTADGQHLFWFANHAKRLQRDGVDLSTETSWQAWQTDLTGAHREEIASDKLGECRCTTGSCDETCPYERVWAPAGGLGDFFIATQVVTGQMATAYKASKRYVESGGKWRATDLPTPLQHVLDANQNGEAVVDRIPDTGCCGWANESDDQTLLVRPTGTVTEFDERQTFNNPDYDVSFFSANAALSPDQSQVAMTINATAGFNQPIQLAENGQASPDESAHIRKSLAQLPAVEVKTTQAPVHRVVFLPHATLVGWLSDKELLLLEDHLLVVYDVRSATRHRSDIRVEDATHVFLR